MSSKLRINMFNKNQSAAVLTSISMFKGYTTLAMGYLEEYEETGNESYISSFTFFDGKAASYLTKATKALVG